MVSRTRIKKGTGKASEKTTKDYSIFWLFFIISIVIIFFDQLTKYLITQNIIVGEKHWLISNFLALTNMHNTGVAFSLLSGNAWIPIWLSIIVIGFFMIFYDKINTKPLAVFTSLLFAGIVGNLIDRLASGYVIDFISFTFWPAFNIADIALTAGIIGLIVVIWKK